jgi:uncharacterized small protein (DUF1192 family)
MPAPSDEKALRFKNRPAKPAQAPPKAAREKWTWYDVNGESKFWLGHGHWACPCGAQRSNCKDCMKAEGKQTSQARTQGRSAEEKVAAAAQRAEDKLLAWTTSHSYRDKQRSMLRTAGVLAVQGSRSVLVETKMPAFETRMATQIAAATDEPEREALKQVVREVRAIVAGRLKRSRELAAARAVFRHVLRTEGCLVHVPAAGSDSAFDYFDVNAWTARVEALRAEVQRMKAEVAAGQQGKLETSALQELGSVSCQLDELFAAGTARLAHREQSQLTLARTAMRAHVILRPLSAAHCDAPQTEEGVFAVLRDEEAVEAAQELLDRGQLSEELRLGLKHALFARKTALLSFRIMRSRSHRGQRAIELAQRAVGKRQQQRNFAPHLARQIRPVQIEASRFEPLPADVGLPPSSVDGVEEGKWKVYFATHGEFYEPECVHSDPYWRNHKTCKETTGQLFMKR